MKSRASNIKRYTRSRVGNIFYFTILFAAGLFTILPLIYSLITSFKPLDELLAFPPRFYVKRPTFANYAALPGLISKLSVPLSRYVFNSVFVTVITTVLHVIVASMASFSLTQWKNRWIKVLFIVVQFSLLYNAYTLSVPQYLIFSKLKIVDTYLVYILPYIPSALGVFLMKQYMESSIPDALIEAARIDGAGYTRIFFQIAFPLVKPCWMTLTLFAFRDMWSIQPAGTVFSENIKTLPMVLGQVTAGGLARSGSAMAATVLLMIPPILVYVITQSNVMETMSSAGIKE